MSIAQTWSGWVTGTLRSRYDLVPRRRLRGIGPAIDRLDSHALHQRRDMPAADHDALLVQQITQHPAARERPFEMQFVHLPHDGEIGRRNRPGQVVNAATADVEHPRLLGNGQIVRTIDHRFALSRPALPSAPSKKSFSSVSSPILAWSDFTSTAGVLAPPPAADPNTPAAPS